MILIILILHRTTQQVIFRRLRKTNSFLQQFYQKLPQHLAQLIISILSIIVLEICLFVKNAH